MRRQPSPPSTNCSKKRKRFPLFRRHLVEDHRGIPMLTSLLSDIRVHGYLALWIIVFLGSAGLPLPVDPLLLAAGALAGHGELNPLMVALVAISAAGCGDAIGYLL